MKRRRIWIQILRWSRPYLCKSPIPCRSLSPTLEDSLVSGRFVTVRERASWTSESGEERSQASVAVYEIRDGLVARVWYYPAE